MSDHTTTTPMPSPIPRLDITEFREAGYLQEANRQFFHPVGLALEVIQEADGTERLGGVWDYRTDPEGMLFGPDVLSAEKADRVARERASKQIRRFREAACVGGVQPLDPPISVEAEAAQVKALVAQLNEAMFRLSKRGVAVFCDAVHLAATQHTQAYPKVTVTMRLMREL